MTLVLEHVRQTGGGEKIILDLTLRIPPGITAVMGPNGSGKTTLLKTAGGLLPPERGAVYFKGISVYPNRGAIRAGYVPQEKAISLPLKVKEALLYLGALYGARNGKAEALLEEWGLREAASRPLQQLSPGETRRFLIAQSILGDPDLLILDEATTGLDSLYRPLLHQKINRFRSSGATVLMATHFIEDVFPIADMLVVLENGGTIKYRGSPAAELLLENSSREYD